MSRHCRHLACTGGLLPYRPAGLISNSPSTHGCKKAGFRKTATLLTLTIVYIHDSALIPMRLTCQGCPRNTTGRGLRSRSNRPATPMAPVPTQCQIHTAGTLSRSRQLELFLRRAGFRMVGRCETLSCTPTIASYTSVQVHHNRFLRFEF
ncbi:hypothetical protein L209DRAFT_448741 [Thermothelomyces heterothallicus CBS 203.75]